MKTRRIPSLAAALALVTPGCATLSGPSRADGYGGVPIDESLKMLSQVPVCGHRVSVDPVYGRERVKGELIAANAEALWVLADNDRIIPVVKIPNADVAKVVVKLYPGQKGIITGWAISGVVSTLTHGYFLILTGPAWLIVGAVTFAVDHGANHLVVREGELPGLREFARYPQGPLPEAVLDDLLPCPGPEIAPSERAKL